MLTLAATDLPLRALCVYLSRRYEVSIVCAEDLDSSIVTVDLRGLDLSGALQMVARRLNCELVQRGNL